MVNFHDAFFDVALKALGQVYISPINMVSHHKSHVSEEYIYIYWVSTFVVGNTCDEKHIKAGMKWHYFALDIREALHNVSPAKWFVYFD